MIQVREASARDAPDIARLLLQLGYDVSIDSIENHLTAAGQAAALVAVDGVRVSGVVALHWGSMLHHPNPIARITTLVVDREERRRGLARLLVDEAAAVAQKAGCDQIELTTGMDRKDAQGFYHAMGFSPSSLRFQRPVPSAP